MKRAGVKPRRDIVLAFSGDEETAMKTSGLLAERLKGAELSMNIDGGGGLYGEDGKPQYFTIGAAEKTDADFQLTVTNAGGHSSAPRHDNAINQLSAVLTRIGGIASRRSGTRSRRDISRAWRRATPSLSARP